MTTITSVVNNAITDANSSLIAANTEQVDETSSTVEQEVTTESESNNAASSVTLSSRAQKIQKLNDEFFSGGPGSVTITPEFIERLYEYGFINASDAEHFGATALASGPTGALGELSSFADSLSTKLFEQNPDDSFVVTLQNARSIIDNFDSAQPADLAANIKLVSAEIKEYLSSEQAQLLSDDDKKSLEQLSLALSIADRLTPSKLTSDKLNNYLANIAGS